MARALPRKEAELPLRELEAFTRAGLTRFLALFHPRIATKKAFAFPFFAIATRKSSGMVEPFAEW